jgi:hypothetical protein
MLHIIDNLQDNLLNLIKDDPVRPEIPAEQRVNENSRIFVLKDDNDRPLAVTCSIQFGAMLRVRVAI